MHWYPIRLNCPWYVSRRHKSVSLVESACISLHGSRIYAEHTNTSRTGCQVWWRLNERNFVTRSEDPERDRALSLSSIRALVSFELYSRTFLCTIVKKKERERKSVPTIGPCESSVRDRARGRPRNFNGISYRDPKHLVDAALARTRTHFCAERIARINIYALAGNAHVCACKRTHAKSDFYGQS